MHKPTVSAIEATHSSPAIPAEAVHNRGAMRVLIADRNARLLEAIARTFARQFAIHTAASHEQCSELLGQGAFDLVVISEKLADGLGLQLLGQVARESPDTLRVFAARRSRLQLLKGKLGPFGLFRTLAYPIDPKELLSLLTLAHAGLEMREPVGAAVPLQAGSAGAPAPDGPVQPIAEQISFTGGDAAFAIDVPRMIASTKRRRRPKSAPASGPAAPRAAPRVSAGSPARSAQPPGPAPDARNVAPGAVSAPSQERGVASNAPGGTPQAHAGPAQRHVPQQGIAPAQHHAPQPSPPQAQHPGSQPLRPPTGQHLPPASVSSQHDTVLRAPPRLPPRRPAHQHRPSMHEDAKRSPIRTKVVLGATIAAVFVATTLALNLLDGGVHMTRASTPSPDITRAAAYTPPPPAPTPIGPVFQPTPQVVHRAEPKPAATNSDVEPADPQMAGNTPVADPSTFGSEAYEPIYSN